MNNKNIKVLHIISSLEQGGAERQLVELVKRNNNHAICQLFGKNIFETETKKNKILLFNLNIKKNILAILSLYKLYGIIKKYKPEIIHTWMYHSSLIEVLLRKIIFSTKIPLIWGLRCSNMDMRHYSTMLNIFILGCKYFSNAPNLIINNSKEGQKFHKNLGFKNKNIVIHNGIDHKKFTFNKSQRIKFREKYNISEDAKVFLCVGRNDPMKDHNTLITAFNKIRESNSSSYLILAGSKTQNIKSVPGLLTLGMCKDINIVYSASDIIVSSSAFGEGFSNALAEGMASSLIPIATNVGDSKYIVGDVGKIVAPRNIDKLFLAMQEVLNMDDNLFQKKKSFARERIKKKFSITKMIISYDDVYKNIIGSTFK